MLGYDPESTIQDADIEILEIAEQVLSYEEALKGRCQECNGRGGITDFNNHGNRKGWNVCYRCGGAGELF